MNISDSFIPQSLGFLVESQIVANTAQYDARDIVRVVYTEYRDVLVFHRGFDESKSTALLANVDGSHTAL